MKLHGSYHWKDLYRGWIHIYSGFTNKIQASVEENGGYDDHIKATASSDCGNGVM